MRDKKKDKKAKDASNKAIIASVTEEMAQPRMAKSASTKANILTHARNGKPA